MTAAATWLRVVIYESRGGDYDESLEVLESKIQGFLRVLKAQPGFVVAYWGHNPEDGTIAAVTHWRSRQAIQDASSELKQLQSQGLEHDIHVVSVQNLELFTVPAALSMWNDVDKIDKGDQNGTAHARHLFRLHR